MLGRVSEGRWEGVEGIEIGFVFGEFRSFFIFEVGEKVMRMMRVFL